MNVDRNTDKVICLPPGLELVPVDGVTEDRYHFNFTGVRSTLEVVCSTIVFIPSSTFEGSDGVRSQGTSFGSGMVGCEVCLVAGVGTFRLSSMSFVFLAPN